MPGRRRLAALVALVAVGAVLACVAVVALRAAGAGPADAASGGGSEGGSVGALGGAAEGARDVSVSAGAPEGAIAPGFLGFSFEFQGVRAYTGADPRHVNPVLVALMRNLTPGQAPVLRIGGDSTDISYVPTPGVRPPSWVNYPLTGSWLATTAALQRALGARMIMGLNLAADEPALAAAEAHAYERSMGRGAIDAMEIGNEPNVYGKITVQHTVFGIPIAARPPDYTYDQYHRDFDAVAAAVGAGAGAGAGAGGGAGARGGAVAGPALALGPTPGPDSWVQSLPGFLASERRLSTMTVHRYPLRNCYVPPSSPQYPSISHLLSSYATIGLADSLRRWIEMAHAQGRRLRVDELNSVACRGRAGVSDTFASALWVTDALFALADAGADGVNMHTLPDAAYELFAFHHAGGRWSASVRPVYYGLELFAQAAPAGARLLRTDARGAGPALSVWATRAADGVVRFVLINKSETRDRVVRVAVPAGAAGSATVERMTAPSVRAKTGVTLGGRSYGASTTTGRLGVPRAATVAASGGAVSVAVPHGSAALVTLAAR